MHIWSRLAFIGMHVTELVAQSRLLPVHVFLLCNFIFKLAVSKKQPEYTQNASR